MRNDTIAAIRRARPHRRVRRRARLTRPREAGGCRGVDPRRRGRPRGAGSRCSACASGTRRSPRPSARVVTNAEELMHGKTSRITHDASAFYDGVPQPFTATRYHSLAVVDGTVPARAHRHEPHRGRRHHGPQRTRRRPSTACSSTPSRCSPRAATACSATGSRSPDFPDARERRGAPATRWSPALTRRSAGAVGQHRPRSAAARHRAPATAA